MEETQVLSKGEKIKKIVSIVLNVLFYFFLALLFIWSIANIKGAKSADGDDRIPNVFGYGYSQVLTGSMSPEFEQGEIIISKIANKNRIEKLQVGDIITFRDIYLSRTLADLGVKNSTNLTLNTHRIVAIEIDADGDKVYYCQGDYLKGTGNYWDASKSIEDNYAALSNYVQKVTADDIKAMYVKNMGNGLTKVISFLKTGVGFTLLIVLPTSILLVFEAVVLVINIIKLNKEKMQAQMEANKEITEEEKQKLYEETKAKMEEEIRAKLMAEMMAKQSAQPSAQEETKEEKTEE